MSVTLGDLIARDIALELRGDASTAIGGVRHDSREVEAGDLFVAVPGMSRQGASFARAALERGAAAIAAEEWIDDVEAPQLKVAGARRALALASELVYGEPTASLSTVGVTGTNGKTTTTWLIDEALGVLGLRPALLGTIETRGPGFRETSRFTTPEADAIARFARRMVDAGASHLVMEVSSHALALHRADGVRFEVAAFTNLTRDHLDLHQTMEAYFEAKARLFLELRPRHTVIRIDDPHGRALAERVGPSALTVGRIARDAKVRVVEHAIDRAGVRAEIETPWGPLELESALIGGHNLDNLLVAAGCLLALGIAPGDAGRALGACRGAPGRLERVVDPREVTVVVDYAHSPDAIENVLAALRPLTPGRLLCVFGCGGDRDRGKRPKMGEAAGRSADLVVVTSDNPRTEDPASIIEMIIPGVVAAGMPEIPASAWNEAARGFTIEVDRRTAIGLALACAKRGDTVLIAGKGHEDYQIVGATKLPFDDRVEAAAAIASFASTGGRA